MQANKILLATDFSDYSDTALHFATSLARDSGASLLFVHVVEPPPASADRGFGGYALEAETDVEAEKLLSEMKPADEGVAFTHRLLHGPAAREIVHCAEEEHADLIVIGSHGRRGLMRMLMGSVAEAVVRKAKCPVITVKQPVADEVATE